MKKNIVVLGLGRFGYALATRLYEKDLFVTAVDSDMTKVERIADKISSSVCADITEEVAMKSLGISNYDIAIIATGSDLEASIEATLICKDSGVERVIAKASSQSHARILKKIGADRIVYPEIDTAEYLTRVLSESNILENIHLSDDFSVVEIKAHKNWVGKSLIDLDFRKNYQLNVVAFKRDDLTLVDFNPEEPIKENDVLVLIGSDENIHSLGEDVDKG